MKQLLDEWNMSIQTQNHCDGRGFFVSHDINFTVVDLSEVSKAYLVFENRRKGGHEVHLRFEYANKKYDLILFRRQLSVS